MVMAEITISIKLNEEEVNNILNETEEEKKIYTLSEMIAANKDELNWYKQFMDKYYTTVLRHNPQMLTDLLNRIEDGENIIKELEEGQ